MDAQRLDTGLGQLTTQLVGEFSVTAFVGPRRPSEAWVPPYVLLETYDAHRVRVRRGSWLVVSGVPTTPVPVATISVGCVTPHPHRACVGCRTKETQN